MAVVVYVPSRIGGGDFIDLPAPTAGDDAKAITYDHDTQAFVYAAAGGGTPGGATTQVQYNNAGAFAGDAGMTYDAAADRLTVAGGLVAPSMRPASDSTTALQWQNAAGTPFMYGDSTNGRVAIGGTPGSTLLELKAISSNAYQPQLRLAETSGATVILSCSTFGGVVPYMGTNTNHAFYFVSNNAYRFGVGATGGVSFGSTYYTLDAGAGNVLVEGRIGIAANPPSALLDLAASTTARASLRIRSGVAPTSPNAGDVWFDGTHFYGYTGSATVQLDN